MSNYKTPDYRKTDFFLIIFLFLSFNTGISGQDNTGVTKPQLILVNDTMIIRYGFYGSHPMDIFKVRLEITDSSGRVIPAQSFTGDIGDSIYGGQQKIIMWNMAADNIFINENISVEIYCEKLETIEIAPIQTGTTDSLKGETAENNYIAHKKASGNDASEGAIVYRKHNILLSAIVPGWGLTRLSGGKPYWLIGIAGFGCVGTSIYFNRQAVTDYDNYKVAMNIEESRDYFDQAKQHYLISNVCCYTAIAVWIIDLGFVILRDNHVRKSQSGNQRHVSIGSGYHQDSGTAFIALNYRF